MSRRRRIIPVAFEQLPGVLDPSWSDISVSRSFPEDMRVVRVFDGKSLPGGFPYQRREDHLYMVVESETFAAVPEDKYLPLWEPETQALRSAEVRFEPSEEEGTDAED